MYTKLTQKVLTPFSIGRSTGKKVNENILTARKISKVHHLEDQDEPCTLKFFCFITLCEFFASLISNRGKMTLHLL